MNLSENNINFFFVLLVLKLITYCSIICLNNWPLRCLEVALLHHSQTFKGSICEAVDFLVKSYFINFLSYFTGIFFSTKFNYRLPCFQIFHQKMKNIYFAELLSSKRFFMASFCSFYMCLTVLITVQHLLIAALLKCKNLSAICSFGEKVFSLFC